MTREKTEQLAELIVNVGRLIHKQTGCFGVGNISMLRCRLLQFISDKGDPSMKDVAAYLGVAPPTATVIVRRLVASGLIARKLRKEDGRVVRVAVTAPGKKMIVNTHKKIVGKLHPLLDGLTKKETAALGAVLNKIIAHYER
jgi:DNA-binding MarR family transcriptional regulator